MARKRTTKAALEATLAESQPEDVEAEWRNRNGRDQEIPGRLDLLAEAIRGVRATIKKEGTPSRTSIGNLVQLLKLHKELIHDEERPTHIQLIWNEVDEDLYGGD